MKVERERLSIFIKAGTGYLSDPQRVVCSRMCATPLSLVGGVLNKTLMCVLEGMKRKKGRA